ncbi:PR domain zinc finger protein 15-like [Thrips palmi]|uniref:PR domain zinc finger protein 15-like n=1 Tax=Thrips palmi TaxID=161013 RepID=A0A6P8YHC9_THRPL|nr:PR domain zinc finger protein 15-like [Thrips palmi]
MSVPATMSFSDSEPCPTLNLQVFVCSVCGEDHETENCSVLQSLKQVYDSRILSRARQTLPKDLIVKTLADGSTTVISNVIIAQGTQFGPFQSPLSIDLHPGIVFPLKVFGKSLDEGYYLDTTDEELCNWMCLVAAATNIREQNLICYDVKQSIYFTTTRDVQPGEELRVWYALYYGLKLQALPLSDDSVQEEGFFDLADEAEGRCKSNEEASVLLGQDLLQTLAQHLPAHVLGASRERDVWICKLCGMQESNVASYARHLMTHYHQQINDHPKCNICAKRFLSKKVLQKHMLKFHKSASDGATQMKISLDESQTRDLESSESQVDKGLRFDLKETSGLKLEHDVDSVHESVQPHHSKNSEEKLDNEKSVLSSDSKSISQSPKKSLGSDVSDVSGENGLELHVASNSEQLVIQSNNGESFSKTVNLSGAEDLDKALATGEPITFIVAAPTDGNETFLTNRIVSDKMTQPNIGEPSDASFSLVSPHHSSSPDLGEHENENLAYNCDICHKSFGKCSYLYRHLRKHTGEFTCVTCLAVFARKENLKTHSCSQPKEWFPCSTCGKKFSAKKYLQRHVPMHTGEFSCRECKRNFASRLSLKCHRCSGNKLEPGKVMISCFLCKQSFESEFKLQSHLKAHDLNKNKSGPPKSKICKSHSLQKHAKKKDDSIPELSQSESPERKVFICEVCGAIFKSSSSMKTHRFLHEERKFECGICKKRFHRKDVLQEHLRVHQDANFPCSICGKKYKTKKSLYVHSLIHKGSKRFACGVCGKEFFQKGNLFKHMQTHTSERLYNCEYCEKSFSSKEYFNIHVLSHTQGKIFQCEAEACKRSFVKKHLLDTHRQLYHSNRGFLCKFCNTVIRHRHSVRRHLEKTHGEHQEEWSAPGFLDTLLAELPENLLQLSGDLKLSPKQQEERQHLLESLRKMHFQNKSILTGAPVDTVSSKVFTLSPISTPEVQVTYPNQVDSQVMLQPSQQLTLIDNFLPDYVQTESTMLLGEEHSVIVSESVQGSEGEILLTLVDQESSDSNVPNTTPVLTSAAFGCDIIDPGGTFMMEDINGNNSVLLYVVETSNGEEGDSQDFVWCNDAVRE